MPFNYVCGTNSVRAVNSSASNLKKPGVIMPTPVVNVRRDDSQAVHMLRAEFRRGSIVNFLR